MGLSNVKHSDVNKAIYLYEKEHDEPSAAFILKRVSDFFQKTSRVLSSPVWYGVLFSIRAPSILHHVRCTVRHLHPTQHLTIAETSRVPRIHI